jgi:hypothetical protein
VPHDRAAAHFDHRDLRAVPRRARSLRTGAPGARRIGPARRKSNADALSPGRHPVVDPVVDLDAVAVAESVADSQSLPVAPVTESNADDAKPKSKPIRHFARTIILRSTGTGTRIKLTEK